MYVRRYGTPTDLQYGLVGNGRVFVGNTAPQVHKLCVVLAQGSVLTVQL